MDNEDKFIYHLHNRAGFGIHPANQRKRIGWSRAQMVDRLFDDSKEINLLKLVIDRRKKNRKVGALKILKQLLKSNEDLNRLNIEWINRMAFGKDQLRERMTFFWHNHFATNLPFAILMEDQNNILRTHALGKFGDLLLGVSKDPAMILYLNNHQNKKSAPNENFAREVMELFTLGIGNYTEKDIKEAARAFTGWQVSRDGYFEFNLKDHDSEEKIVLGQKGNWSGEDLLKIILEKREVADFICSKIYREFVNPTLNHSHIREMSQLFFESEYDISKLMRFVLLSDWFYDEKNWGARVKSPVELIVSIKKIAQVRWKDDNNQIKIQKALGQVLFFPPNVAGWPGHHHWIDSSSLLLRLNLPLLLFTQQKNGYNFESRAEPEMKILGKDKLMFDCKFNWKLFNDVYPKDLDDEKKRLSMMNDLLIVEDKSIQKVPKNWVAKKKDQDLTAVVIMMNLPFQLC